MRATDQPPQPIYRKDYAVPSYWIDTVDLEFELGEDTTLVHAKLGVRRNEAAEANAPLELDGERLELVRIAIDGSPLPHAAYTVDEQGLRIVDVPETFQLETTVSIRPQDNTELTGLYRSSGNFCTQCEAEGFRRITFFPDRPDVMARYRVKITADPTACPVLLSNGNRVDSGSTGGKHWVQWEDPFPKPSYLFALVAGRLERHAGTFTTMSGKEVKLEIWVEPQNIDKCEHALRSLQKAMRWDEEVFGREYDLDLYMIVAVNDFNMGAMENKGLNIFNSKYVLARPDTATDDEYIGVESVIAHEYFHNWTGNRVTCRDWFQLTLKEGLTVFRDQQFSMDVWSPGVERIMAVKGLRAVQFAEDAGPMAHPIRPEFYIEMNNFYTATVYRKGAEVVRMYQTLLGRDGFRKGMDLYFERHDGQAVTCDDFRAAMADANGMDLTQFERWYLQAGTPTIRAQGAWNAQTRQFTLELAQEFPKIAKLTQPQPALIPVTVGLLDSTGADVPLRLAGESEASASASRVLKLTEPRQTFVFEDVADAPVPSLMRGFSAPAKLEIERSREELAFLAAHDSDSFNRWDAGQELASDVILELADAAAHARELEVPPILPNVFRRVLADETLDGSLKALALALPDERYLVQRMQVWDVDALHTAREFVLAALARELHDEWREVYASTRNDSTYVLDKPSVDRRRLGNRALAYLAASGDRDSMSLVEKQFDKADNMTEQSAALRLLADLEGAPRERALAKFHAEWRDDPLVLDKWFVVQAQSKLPATRERVAALCTHADFSLQNPNRARSLIATFAQANLVRFHGADGKGYELVADRVIDLDACNPQLASRLVSAFNQWRKLDAHRQDLMRAQLERIAARPKLSKDVFEIVSRALEARS